MEEEKPTKKLKDSGRMTSGQTPNAQQLPRQPELNLPLIEILSEIDFGYWRIRIWQTPETEFNKDIFVTRKLRFLDLLASCFQDQVSNPMDIARVIYGDNVVTAVEVKGTHGSVILYKNWP